MLIRCRRTGTARGVFPVERIAARPCCVLAAAGAPNNSILVDCDFQRSVKRVLERAPEPAHAGLLCFFTMLAHSCFHTGNHEQCGAWPDGRVTGPGGRIDSRPGGWLWVTDHRLDAELGHENGFFPSRRAVWEICCPSRCTRVLNPARELAPTSGGSPHRVGQPAATGGCTVRVGRRGRAVADAAGMQGCRSLAEGSNGIVPSRISWCSSPQIVRCT